MEEYLEQPIIDEYIDEIVKVYVRINQNNEVTDVDSDSFLRDMVGWIEIDSGVGDRYRLAQSQYFEKPLMNEDGSYNYHYINGSIKE